MNEDLSRNNFGRGQILRVRGTVIRKHTPGKVTFG